MSSLNSTLTEKSSAGDRPPLLSASKELVPKKPKAETINLMEDDDEPEEEGNPPLEEIVMEQGEDEIGGNLDKPEGVFHKISIPIGQVEEGLIGAPLLHAGEKNKDDFNSYTEEDPAHRDVTTPLTLILYRTDCQVNLPKMEWWIIKIRN